MLSFSESGHPVFGTRRWKLSTHFCGDDNTAQLVLRTIISVNQLSTYGAVADVCDELTCRISGCSVPFWEPVAQNTPETTVTPAELSTTNETPLTNDNVQGHLLHDEQKIVNLPDHLQLIKLCSSVGITKTVARGRYFTILHDAVDKLGGSCREYTSPRDNASKSDRMDPWKHEDRSSFGGGSQSPRPLRNWDPYLVMELFPGWESWME